jgi:RimJ/RimL family protein N-acetyltransferase
VIRLETPRLLLRPWQPADRAPFAALNADPEVMRYFPAVLTRAQSDTFAARIEAQFAEDGWGLWAVERRDTAGFIGFVGLMRLGFVPPFSTVQTPPIEIGWRLARAHWGCGFATEAAEAALQFAFARLGLPEVVSITAAVNGPSEAVMGRIGMVADGSFVHPSLATGHWLSRHVLYRADGGPHA